METTARAPTTTTAAPAKTYRRPGHDELRIGIDVEDRKPGVWDDAHRTLFAARDRFGIKPLFYTFHDETLYLASEVKALFAAGVPARWDAESVAQSVEMGGHQVRTPFDGVFQVPPGHYLIATDKHFQLVPYWDFNYPAKAAEPAPQPRSEKGRRPARQAREHG